MAIDEARFRQAMGYFASGVTVVTTTSEGSHYGMTVSSFSSLSLRPPLVLVCIDNQVGGYSAFMGASGFVINILEKGQEHVSRKFAGPSDDRFTGVAWHLGVLGFPVIEKSLASIECHLYETHVGGDHTIFIGKVAEIELGDGSPLLYYRRGYHSLR